MGKMKTSRKLPSMEQLRGRALGRVLTKMGVLTRDKVHECIRIQKQRQGKVKIGQIFIELGLIDEDQLQTALAAQRGMEYIKLDGMDIPPDVIQMINPQMVQTH
ncbi:MAG: hypothetical protein ACYSTX_01575, partial [Planctomycetota bacterium]